MSDVLILDAISKTYNLGKANALNVLDGASLALQTGDLQRRQPNLERIEDLDRRQQLQCLVMASIGHGGFGIGQNRRDATAIPLLESLIQLLLQLGFDGRLVR